MFKKLSNFELLELLRDLDLRLSEEDEIVMTEWELDFVESMISILSDSEIYDKPTVLLSSKQRECIIDILEKYS
jgi:hypothetical protein